MNDSTKPLSGSQQDLSTTWNTGTEILPGYTVQKLLGSGGFGQVFLVDRRISGQTFHFAVKILHGNIGEDTEQGKAFLRELRTWIELPTHPNIVRCRFHRWISGRLAIFSDYMDGRSLHEWIAERKLCSLESILDVSLQIARGIEAAHDQGVIHQDIKPSNVMLTSAQEARITDFGLAGSTLDALQSHLETTRGSTGLISSRGFTPAFCSPEQASGLRVNRKTDIWSYGLTILQMFAGRITWRFGPMAAIALDQYLMNNPDAVLPRMPDSITSILRWCFQESIDKRPQNMRAVIDALTDAYVELFGKKPQSAASESSGRMVDQPEYLRAHENGMKWEDPVRLLGEAVRDATNGQTELSAERTIPRSRRAQALLDIEVYDIAIRELHFAARFDDRFQFPLAVALMNKGCILHITHDPNSADTLYVQAETILRKHIHERAAARKLITLLMWRGLAADALNRYADAERINCELLSLNESLAECFSSENDRIHARLSALMNLGSNHFDQNRLEIAIEINQTADLQATSALTADPGNSDFREILARVKMNLGLVYLRRTDLDDAERLVHEAVAFFEDLKTRSQDTVIRKSLAKSRMNLAVIISMKGSHEESIRILDESIADFESIASPEFPGEFSRLRLAAMFNKAMAQWFLGQAESAIELLVSVERRLEEFVYLYGQDTLLIRLGAVISEIAQILLDQRQYDKASGFIEQAIGVQSEIVTKHGTIQSKLNVINAVTMKAECLAASGKPLDALASATIASNLIESFPDQTDSTLDQFKARIQSIRQIVPDSLV